MHSRLTQLRIRLIKISDDTHGVEVERADGSCERVELKSREFLNHDLAHFAIESELPIRNGYWGCVASGASLSGEGVAGADAQLAESLAGPTQTLIRTNAGPDAYTELFRSIGTSPNLGARVHDRVRRLRGHWKATRYGQAMELDWPNSTGEDCG